VTASAPHPLDYPLAVIDFEATALALTSYPIEVGLGILVKPGEAITIWSSLIMPAADWDVAAQWDPDAERVHGISRWELREGCEPPLVMAELNARIPAGSTVWCDGGAYDQHWLDVLADAAEVTPTFWLADLAAALRGNPILRERYLTASGRTARPHRAGDDAALICAALAAAISP